MINLEIDKKAKTMILVAFGVFLGIAYILLSNSIKDTEYIWFLTRIFGLLAYTFLIILILTGEIRMMAKPLWPSFLNYHKPIGIFTVFLALLHGISAVFDKFQWGKNLHFVDYLGFNFSSKWLLLLSLGTIAFYLIIVVAISSMGKNMGRLGFKNWKILHYLSYLSLVIVFIHSIYLGTDTRHSQFTFIVFPFIVISFIIVTWLFMMRVMKGFNLLNDRTESILAGIFILLMLICAAFFMYQTNSKDEFASRLIFDINSTRQDIADISSQNIAINEEISSLKDQIQVVKNG